MMVWLGVKKFVNYFKLRHDICICIFVCMTKYNQISRNLNEIPLVLVRGAKLLQWYYWFGMAISAWPVGQITWPKDWFVAKGLYFVYPHQSKVKFPQVFVVHFMHHIKVRHCNSFGDHCIQVVKAFPCCIGDGAGESMERPVKGDGHWVHSLCECL